MIASGNLFLRALEQRTVQDKCSGIALLCPYFAIGRKPKVVSVNTGKQSRFFQKPTLKMAH